MADHKMNQVILTIKICCTTADDCIRDHSYTGMFMTGMLL